jgi:hypothetical protein
MQCRATKNEEMKPLLTYKYIITLAGSGGIKKIIFIIYYGWYIVLYYKLIIVIGRVEAIGYRAGDSLRFRRCHQVRPLD